MKMLVLLEAKRVRRIPAGNCARLGRRRPTARPIPGTEDHLLTEPVRDLPMADILGGALVPWRRM